MPNKISEEKKEEISRLYNNGIGISPAKIARQTGVSYTTAYGLTRLTKRINPETRKKFKSKSEYQDYRARQRINPETKKPYESLTQLEDYQARQRAKRKKNKKLAGFIKKRLEELGKNQSWLAKQINITRAAVSLYTHGKLVPKKETLERLFYILNSDNKTNKSSNIMTISLEDLVEN